MGRRNRFFTFSGLTDACLSEVACQQKNLPVGECSVQGGIISRNRRAYLEGGSVDYLLWRRKRGLLRESRRDAFQGRCRTVPGNAEQNCFQGEGNHLQGEGNHLQGKGTAFKGKRTAFKGKRTAFKGKETTFKGKGTTFKGMGTTFKGREPPSRGREPPSRGREPPSRGREPPSRARKRRTF